jgi:hypothetical protein
MPKPKKKGPSRAKYSPEELKARKSAQAKAQWAARDGAGGLRQAVVTAVTKEPPANAVEIVERACSQGCTVQQVAKALGVGRELFSQWRERYPEIEAAMQLGRQVEHDALVGVLFRAAMEGSVVPAIFLLKSRHGYAEGVALVSNTVSINYQLPAPMSPADYLKTIEAETTMKPDAARALLENPKVKTALKNDFVRQRRELEMGE